VGEAKEQVLRALIKYAAGRGNVEVREVPVRRPGPDELLIRVRYCGICGTDLHIEADEFPNSPPVIMGHEYCGTVAEVGSAVRGEWSVGDRVVGELHAGACGECHLCRAGKPHICDRKLALGSRYDGALAEYVTIPAWLAHRLPEEIPWVVAGVTEPFAIAAHCLLERGALRAGQSVHISGSGTMGLMAIIWASRVGAEPIIVSGTSQDETLRFPLALQMGATEVVNVEQGGLREAVLAATNGEGVDVWVEASGAAAAVRGGVGLLHKTGRAILIGLMGTETIEVPWNDLLYKEIDVVGCFSSPPSSWETALAAEPEEAPKLRRLVTAILPLEEWAEGFAMMRSGGAVKVLIDLEA